MKNKNITKLLNQTLVVYILALIVILAIKIMGVDYFEIDVGNNVFIKLEEILNIGIINDIWNCINLYIYSFIMISVIFNLKKPVKESIFVTTLGAISQTLLHSFNLLSLTPLFEMLIWLIIFIILRKKIRMSRMVKYITIIVLYQITTLFCRVDLSTMYMDSIVVQNILSLDFLILNIIYYKLYWEGDGLKCSILFKELGNLVGSFLQIMTLPKRLFQVYRNQSSSKLRFEFIMMFVILLIWNILTFCLILFVAMLNDTIIECVFLISSFTISKGVFGKEFHMKSVLMCFSISNVSYYIMNRITLPIEISIMASVILGVGLAYITSLFVKTKLSKLYRGMPLDVFQETILKVTDENSDDYKICKLFYIDRWSDNKISMKINYSVPSVKLKKKKINDKILEL